MNKLAKFCTSVICIIFMLSSFNINAQNDEDDSSNFNVTLTTDQQDLITKSLETYPTNTQFSIAIIEGDDTKYIGVKNENGQLSNCANSKKVFEIGSITKVFTSTLLAQAILKKDLTLESQIDEILGYTLKNDKKINVLQLSNHTSGLMRMPMNFMFAQQKDSDNPYIHYKEEHLKDWLTTYMNPSEADEKSEYSNLGAALLAHVLTIKYKKVYNDLLKENIFDPLGMNSSTTDLKEVGNKLVKGLNPGGTEAKNWEWDVLRGAGAILSSVSDLELFAREIINGKNEALNLQLESTFVVNENFEMGMAWHIFKGENGNILHFHNGGTGGYSSSMLLDVKNKKAVIILTNVSAFHSNMGGIDNLTFGLMKTLN